MASAGRTRTTGSAHGSLALGGPADGGWSDIGGQDPDRADTGANRISGPGQRPGPVHLGANRPGGAGPAPAGFEPSSMADQSPGTGTGHQDLGAAAPRRRRSTIRTRLTSVLAIPLVAILVLLGDLVIKEVDEYSTANEVTRTIEISQHAQSLVHTLQHERGLTIGVLGGAPDDRAELDRERPDTDQQRSAMAKALGAGDGDHASARTALAQLDDLTAIRAQVDAGRIDRATAFQYYTDRISALNHVDLGLDVPVPDPDPDLRRSIAAYGALAEAKEALAAESAVLLGVFTALHFSRDEYSQFSAVRAERQTALTEFTRFATPSQRALLDTVLRSREYTEAARYEQIALGAADGRKIELDEEAWWQAVTATIDKLRTVEQAVGAAIHDHTDELRSEAVFDLTGLGLLVLASVLGAVVLSILATRSIVRPLRALAVEADDIAGARLPAAVNVIQSGTAESEPPAGVRPPPQASEEIWSVATAIDRMQRTAYELATQQAALRRNTVDSLANLGRRTQNLLRRQLAFISQLEREEGDPTALANLFELDHLATRLRRNAESLLVLVGETTPRRWSRPLPIADVLRAAVAEVEEYRRVALRRIDDAFVGGAFVTDLAHMLAELIENGLTFSPPDVDVEIHGRHLGRGYLIAIVDHGVGMEPDALARANARLRGEEQFTVAPTRFLGHYVVGDLARGLDVDVQLVQSPVTGVTARVVLPASVLALPGALGPAESGPAGSAARGAAAVGTAQGGAAVGSAPATGGTTTAVGAGQPTAPTSTTGTSAPGMPMPGTPAPGTPAPSAPMPSPAQPTEWPPAGIRAGTPADVRAGTPAGQRGTPTGRGAATPPPPFGLGPFDTATFDPVTVGMTAPQPMVPTAPAAAPGAGGPTPADRGGTGAGPGTGGSLGQTVGSNGRPDLDRTQNGLPKRAPRTRIVPSSQPTAERQRETPAADRKPTEVRTMLTSLREGIRRGETGQSAETTWFSGGEDR